MQLAFDEADADDVVGAIVLTGQGRAFCAGVDLDHLARIAAGESDLWISAVPKSEWDVCAGDLLVREAGGVFATRDAGERRYNARDPKIFAPMAAGPRPLVDEFLARCRS